MHIDLTRHLREDLKDFETLRDIRFARSPRDAAASLLLKDICRKDSSLRGEGCAEEATRQWEAMNELCKKEFILPPLSDKSSLILCRGRQLLDSWIPTPHFSFKLDVADGAFGPGATLDHKWTSLNSKLTDCPYTYTDVNNVAFYLCSLKSPTSIETESSRNARHGFKRVVGSKFSTVPKDIKTDRAICIEPLLNMYKQQAIRMSLERILRAKVGINLSTQQGIQQQLARRGSVDGSIATIDLTSASDTISTSFCRWYLPFGLHEELFIARSPFTMIGRRKVQNHMISSMGNATTFPLQTLIFASIAAAACEIEKITPRFRGKKRNIGVFGDDIAVPTVVYPALVEALKVAGFLPSPTKCFHFGSFRESCGGDYFAGVSVTPVRVKNGLDRAGLTSLLNRLILWSTEHEIYLPSTIAFIKQQLRHINYVPPYESPDAGVWSTFNRPTKYLVYVARQRRVIQKLVSLDAVLAGGIVDNEFCIERSIKTRYRAGYRRSVSIPTTSIDLGDLPGPVTSLLTVPVHRWVRTLSMYDLLNQ